MFKIIRAVLLGICVFTLVPSTAANVNRTELLKAANIKTSGEYVRKHFLQLMKKPFDQADKKKALIIGDSHAQDFLNSILENNSLSEYQISTRYIPVRCQVFLGGNAAQHIAAKDQNFCTKSDSLLKAKKQITEADLIIIAADWKKWSAKLLPKTINNLALSPNQKLFVIGSKSFGKISIRKYLRMSNEELARLRNMPKAHHIKVNDIMRQSLSKGTFIDLHEKICGKSDGCPVFTNDLKLISFDGGHLTKEGAKHIGKVLFQSTALGDL